MSLKHTHLYLYDQLNILTIVSNCELKYIPWRKVLTCDDDYSKENNSNASAGLNVWKYDPGGRGSAFAACQFYR